MALSIEIPVSYAAKHAARGEAKGFKFAREEYVERCTEHMYYPDFDATAWRAQELEQMCTAYFLKQAFESRDGLSAFAYSWSVAMGKKGEHPRGFPYELLQGLTELTTQETGVYSEFAPLAENVAWFCNLARQSGFAQQPAFCKLVARCNMASAVWALLEPSQATPSAFDFHYLLKAAFDMGAFEILKEANRDLYSIFLAPCKYLQLALAVAVGGVCVDLQDTNRLTMQSAERTVFGPKTGAWQHKLDADVVDADWRMVMLKRAMESGNLSVVLHHKHG